MINTVLGPVKASELGTTLCHEHIMWNPRGAGNEADYDRDKILKKMLPYLLELKKLGCNTLVDGTPFGSGRDIKLLQECSRKSGLHILTCTGAWDGESSERYIPEKLKISTIEEIASIWTTEIEQGIAGTGVKPGFIKIALGDAGKVTELQHKLLRAAAQASNTTGLPLQCHMIPSKVVTEVVEILEDEQMPLSRLVWLHADTEKNYPLIIQLMNKGVWVEFDWTLSTATDFSWYVTKIKDLVSTNLIDKLLISQDAGIYIVGVNEDAFSIRPYSRVFKEFVPHCLEQGISQRTIDQIFIENPSIVLNSGFTS